MKQNITHEVSKLTKKYNAFDTSEIKNYMSNLESFKNPLLDKFNQNSLEFCYALINLSQPSSRLIKWSNINIFCNTLGVSLWNIVFKTLENVSINDIQDLYSDIHLNYIFEIISKKDINQNNLESLKSFFEKEGNRELVINTITSSLRKLNTLYFYRYIIDEDNIDYYKLNFYYDGFYKITTSLFDLNIWEEFINYSILANPFKIPKLINDYKWVFSNIKNIKFNKLENVLNERIETYSKLTKSNFKKYCDAIVEYTHIYLKISEINPIVEKSFRDIFTKNASKFMVIHGIEKYLDRLLNLPSWNPTAFDSIDELGYVPLFDILRYGNYSTTYWYFNNILNDTSKLYDALYNVLVVNMGMSYIFNNKDWRVLKITLNTISDRLTNDNINTLDFSLVRSETPRNDFSKKTKIMIDFMARYRIDRGNFSYNNSIITNLLYYESLILDKSFQPFIIPYINKINKKQILPVFELSNIRDVFHHKYLNFDKIKVIIDMSNLKQNNNVNINEKKKDVYNFILNNIVMLDENRQIFCACKITKLVTQIVNYVFNLNYSVSNISDVFNFLINGYKKQSIYFKYINKDSIFIYLQKLNFKSKIHCKQDNDTINTQIICILDTILSNNQNGKDIGSFKNYITKVTDWYSRDFENDIQNIKIDISFIKLLFKKGYYFSEFNYVNNFRSFFINSPQNSIKSICSSYFISENQINDFRQYVRKINRTVRIDYYRNVIIINALKKIQKEMQSSKTNFENTILMAKIIFNEFNSQKCSFNTNQNDDYSITQHSNINIIESCIKKMSRLQYSKLEKIKYLLHYFYKKHNKLNSSKDKQVDKLKHKLNEKIRIVIDYLKNDSNKQNQKIHLSNIVFGILNIKIFIKNRISKAFNEHYVNQKQFISEIKEIKNYEKQSQTKDDIQKELDDIFSSEDEDEDDEATYTNKYIIDNLTSTNKTTQITSPSLLSIKSLLSNYKTHAVITQKIDGVTKKNVCLNNSFPRCHLNNMFDVEYTTNNKVAVNFIIGMNNSRLYDEKTFVDLIFELRSKHNYTKETKFPRKIGLSNINDTNLFKLVKRERENFEKYVNEISINHLCKGKLYWWPKMFFELQYNNFTEYLELLKFFEKYSDILGCFKNDGWILAHKDYLCNKDLFNERKVAFKIKPRDLLTVDLLFKDNDWYYGTDQNLINLNSNHTLSIFKNDLEDNIDSQVYRCYPIFENMTNENLDGKLIGYNPREIREDRKHPNPEDIINSIIYQTNNYFKFDELYKLVIKSNSDYYHHGIDYEHIKNKYQNYNYKSIKSFVKDRVLDLGGGHITKTESYLKPVSDNITTCISVDNDINLILDNIAKKEIYINKKTQLQVAFLDYTRNIKEYNKIESQLSIFNYLNTNEKFDTITMMNSLNFALKTRQTLSIFMDYLDILSKQGTKLIIRWMDLDIFEEKHNIIVKNKSNTVLLKSPHDSSFVKIDFNNKKNRIYYKWTHEKPVDEILIGKTDLINIFSGRNWNYINYEPQTTFQKLPSKYIENTSLWDLYFKSFSVIVFEKNQ